MDFLLNHAYSYLLGLVAFLVFVGLIARYGVGPLLRLLDERERHIRDELAAAARARQQAAAHETELGRRLSEIEVTIAGLRREAGCEAEQLRAQAVAAGAAEVERIRQQGLKDLAAARQAAIQGLREEVAEIATLAASRILRAEIDGERHRRLVLETIAEVDAAPRGRT
jgi:F-type H+-transporting ATPase subunit b